MQYLISKHFKGYSPDCSTFLCIVIIEMGLSPCSSESEIGQSPCSSESEIGQSPCSFESEIGRSPSSSEFLVLFSQLTGVK